MTFGMRVMPPTRITSLISAAVRPASFSAERQGADGLLDQILDQRLQLGAGQLDVQVLRPGRVGGDERQVDLGLHRRGQLDLGLLGRFLQALQGQPVLAQIDALLLLELVGQVVDDPLVEVLAAEEGVAVGRLHLEDAVADLQDRDVEGAAAEVVDGDRAGALLVQAVGERGRGRLVDDAQHVEAGDLAGVLGRLALAVVEVGGNGDHRLLDLLAEIVLGGLLHLLQDEGGNLLRAVLLALRLDPGVAVGALDDLVGHHALVLLGDRVVVAPADQPLDGEQGVLRIGHRLALGRLADQPLAGVGEGDDRRRRARAFGVLDDANVLAFHDGDAGVRRAEVDADYFAHCSHLFLRRVRATQPGVARPRTPNLKHGVGAGGGDGRDPMFEDALRLICQYDKASASLLQRRLSVGYARAARILDQLEESGIIGPAEGSKPRDVLVKNPDEYLAQQQETNQ